MTLEPVRTEDYQFLYDLLGERTAKVNISHRNTPTWADHVKFCSSNPYPHRYIIWIGPLRVGTIYLTDRNEIGLFICKDYQGRGFGKQALDLLLQQVKGPIYANINPCNTESIAFFKGEGFKLCQITYKLS